MPLGLYHICIYYMIYKYMYTQERIQGGGIGSCPPPEQFQGGGLSPPEDCPPPEQFRGGDSQNVPPLSDSGGGQKSLRGGTKKFSGAHIIVYDKHIDLILVHTQQ